MTKSTERDEARRLRRDEGLSLKEICDVLKVSKSSASVWVRDLPLTEDQLVVLEARLDEQHAVRLKNGRLGAHTNIRKGRELRMKYQEEGRRKARENDSLHIAGCMLYWGEGLKDRNVLALANSDPDLISFFVKFLRDSLQVKDEEIRIRIFCYLNNGLSESEITDFWLKLLHLPQSCLRKTRVNVQPSSSQQKGRKLVHGVCEVSIYETKLVQQVFGAIQEYTGLDKPEWLE